MAKARQVDTADYNWIIGRLYSLLESYGWTIYRLAKESDIPYSSLNNLFIRNTMPTLSTLEKICDGFGITLSYFFAEQPQNISIDDLDTTEKRVEHKLRMLGLCTESAEETALLKKYRLLDREDKIRLEAYITGLAKQIE